MTKSRDESAALTMPRCAAASSHLTIPFFTIIAVVFAATAMAQEKGGCEGETISMSMSPDDKWVALVQEDACSDGYFVTTITDTVQLARRDVRATVQLTQHAEVPRHENDVFALDEHGHPENRPVARWLTPQKVLITIPNKSLIGLQKSSYEGIAIEIKYEPDDPAERERWLKSLGLSSK